MSSEPCLICQGRGRREDGQACPYCQGGRVQVQAPGDGQVWLQTGSCKVPAKRVSRSRVDASIPSRTA